VLLFFSWSLASPQPWFFGQAAVAQNIQNFEEEDASIELNVGKVRITVSPGFNHELLGEVLRVIAV